MATVNAGDVTATLKLKDELSGPLSRIAGSFGPIGSNLANLALAGGVAGAAFKAAELAVNAFVNAIRDTINAVVQLASRGEDIQNRALISGFAIEATQQFERLAKNAGSSSQAITFAVTRMQRAAASGSAGFKRLGIDVGTFLQLKPEDQLKAVADRLFAIEDPARRTAAAIDAFGRSGAQLLPVLKQIAEGGEVMKVSLSEEQVQGLANLDDALDNVSGSLDDVKEQFFAVIATTPEFVDILTVLAGALNLVAKGVAEAGRLIKEYGASIDSIIPGTKNALEQLKEYVAVLREIGPPINAATRATMAHGFEMAKLGSPESIPSVNEQLKLLEKGLDEEIKKTKEVLKPIDEHAKKLKELKAAISDVGIAATQAQKVKDLEAVIKQLGGASALSAGELTRFVAELRQLGSAGQAAIQGLGPGGPLEAMTQAFNEMGPAIASATKDAADGMADLGLESEGLIPTLEEFEAKQKAITDAENAAVAAHQQNAGELANLAGAFDSLGSSIGGAAGNAIQFGAQGVQIFSNLEARHGMSTLQRTAAAASQFGSALQSAGQAGTAAGAAIRGAMGGASAGAMFGPIGAGVGAVAGALGGLFMRARRLREEARKMRDEFIQSAGGLDTLRIRANEAGVSLDALMKARDPTAAAAAIEKIKKAIETHDEAWRKVKEAMDRYGITIEQMGPKFAQQQLDQQAMKLLEDYRLLTAAGAQWETVIAAMAPAMQEYINAALASGATVPEAMRVQIERMIEMGLLLDENGVAFTSVEDAGITFAETMTEAISRLIERINELVSAILGVQSQAGKGVRIPVSVGDIPGEPGEGGGPRARRNDIPEEFQGGSGGFRDFGAGTPAVLHGREAVVAEGQGLVARLDPQDMDRLVRALRDAILMAG